MQIDDGDGAASSITTGVVAMAAPGPNDVIQLVRSGTINLRTVTGKPLVAPLPAVSFDDVTGDWVPAGLPVPQDFLLTDDLGEDWMMLPGVTVPQQAQA